MVSAGDNLFNVMFPILPPACQKLVLSGERMGTVNSILNLNEYWSGADHEDQ